MEVILSNPVSLLFVGTPGQVAFPDLTFTVNGVVTVVSSSTPSEIASGLFRTTITPSVVGYYTLYVNNKIQQQFTVVTQLTRSILDDIVDESLGSWSWNKSTGVLTLLRRNGTLLNTYNVVDNQNQSSRELV